MAYKKQWDKIYVCRTCGKRYVYLKCLKNHTKKFAHCPVWNTYHSESSMEKLIKNVVSKMNIAFKEDRSEWDIKRERKTLSTKLTNIGSDRGTVNDYSLLMIELRQAQMSMVSV